MYELWNELYREWVPSLQGGFIRLTATVDSIDIWGQLQDGGNPLYPPRNLDKSLEKYGGSVEEYKQSPDRELFHYITIGQYISLIMRVRKLGSSKLLHQKRQSIGLPTPSETSLPEAGGERINGH